MSTPMYRIKNERTGLYWNAGVCDRPKEEGTQFENSERATVRLYQDEVWEKVA